MKTNQLGIAYSRISDTKSVVRRSWSTKSHIYIDSNISLTPFINGTWFKQLFIVKKFNKRVSMLAGIQRKTWEENSLICKTDFSPIYQLFYFMENNKLIFSTANFQIPFSIWRFDCSFNSFKRFHDHHKWYTFLLLTFWIRLEWKKGRIPTRTMSPYWVLLPYIMPQKVLKKLKKHW